MAHPGSALPFLLRRQSDVIGIMEMTTTKETAHGLLRIEEDVLVVQWSTARETQKVGLVMKTDRALDPVREARIPLAGLAGADIGWQWRQWPPGPGLVLRAADLRAFEGLAGEAGLVLEHPAELTLGIRRRDRALAREFAADLEMHLVDQSLKAAERRDRVGPGEQRPGPRISGG
jgi:hypothetical protein